MTPTIVAEPVAEDPIAFAATSAIVHYLFGRLGVTLAKSPGYSSVILSRNASSVHLPVEVHAGYWASCSVGQATLMALRQVCFPPVKGKADMIAVVTGDQDFLARLRALPGFSPGS